MAKNEQPESVEVQTLAKAPQGEIETRALTPAEMLSIAVQNNADTEKLEKLMELQERYEANQARKAYVQAMTNFRAECPIIKQTRTVDFGKGDKHVAYSFAGLPEAVEQIHGLLAQCQLSVTWATVEQTPSWVQVNCTVSHVMGHSESCVLGGPPDTSGNKNQMQAIKSVWSYLRRVTLFSLLGLVDRADVDDDGAGGTDAPPPPEPKSKVNPSLQEAAAAFTAACEKLTERVLARDVVKNLLGQVKNLVGQEQGATSAEDIAACTKWLLEQGRITDGVVIQVGHGHPLTQDELDAADEALDHALNEDDNPGPKYGPTQKCICDSEGHRFDYSMVIVVEDEVLGRMEVCPTCHLKHGFDNPKFHAI